MAGCRKPLRLIPYPPGIADFARAAGTAEFHKLVERGPPMAGRETGSEEVTETGTDAGTGRGAGGGGAGNGHRRTNATRSPPCGIRRTTTRERRRTNRQRSHAPLGADRPGGTPQRPRRAPSNPRSLGRATTWRRRPAQVIRGGHAAIIGNQQRDWRRRIAKLGHTGRSRRPTAPGTVMTNPHERR